MSSGTVKFPGQSEVINGNGAVAHVMKHVCGGVIGYPITPSTEISETFEAARSNGQINVWGKHPFFVETEGEHSAQSGALGAALTGGHYVSNASSSQGILYGLESHYVTAGKKIGGFVLQVAARVVSKHSLNVMAGHDDIYALLPSGYTVLFGSDPQEAADFAAIAYRTSALSLIPVANAMDGFATSHVMSEVMLPEPALLKEYLGDPTSRIVSPTVAQDILFGAKGRVFQLQRQLDRQAADFDPTALSELRAWLTAQAEAVEADNDGQLIVQTESWVPADLRASWRRAWRGAWPKGTRQLVPALVDPHNPGLTGPVQNQPDFQAGSVDHRTHFASAVPTLVRQAMHEYGELTGRQYAPVQRYGPRDADIVVVGLGSITDDARALLPYLASQGIKAAVVSIKLLQPFPEAELVAALRGCRAVTVLERSDDTVLTRLVTQALFKAGASAANLRLTTAIFGLGSHDVQPRHLVATFENMLSGNHSPLVYLGSQFFADKPASSSLRALQDRLRQAYPETEAMALTTRDNPPGLLPESALRIRFHSVGGYGTVATGKLLTDILSGMLQMNSKSSPKYGSEKSGAATNFYITLSPEPVLLTNAQLEDVEVVISPDHKVFVHDRPLRGLVPGGTFILQSDKTPLEVWRSLPAEARRTIRDKKIKFLVIDAFEVAKKHAPTPNLETRMMGIAFIGALIGHVDRVQQAVGDTDISGLIRDELTKKFGSKGTAVVEGNMAVAQDGIAATHIIDYDEPDFLAIDAEVAPTDARTVGLSASMVSSSSRPATSGLFDPEYYDDVMARAFREGTVDENPVLPGAGLFMPPASGAFKNKGVFRREAPLYDPALCTACNECTIACPDSAIPNRAIEIRDVLIAAIKAARDVPAPQQEVLVTLAADWAQAIRRLMVKDKRAKDFPAVARLAASEVEADETGQRALTRHLDALISSLAAYPVSRTRPIFDLMEKRQPGSGALFSVTVDPWKCTGCLQCVNVCGPGALTAQEQTDESLADLEVRFERLTQLPNTPHRFYADATGPDGDIKRLLLNKDNYYALTGGHGACRGCGEVTATHLLTALGRAIGDDQRRSHVTELTELIDQLTAKLDSLSDSDSDRRQRIEQVLADLDQALYLHESGPTGQGPAPTVVANSTGCSSVYASTLPSQPYTMPWVNSLFQDAQAVAVGLFEGLVANYLTEIKALRVAQWELDDAYDDQKAKQLATLTWHHFTPEELTVLPRVLTISGDGAAFDIGFGAMSRVLASRTPVKMMVLDTGVYSNTGGQASTASYTGQNSDLARFGKTHHGKWERRKELGLLAAFHPSVFVAACSAAFYNHYLDSAAQALGYNQGVALLHVYTPCGFEQGFADDLSTARSRLAVESRLMPLFVHDPRKGDTWPERLSLEGNPDVDSPWTTQTLVATNEQGKPEIIDVPLTPAEFAYGEVRFAQHFRLLPAGTADATPIAEFVELTPEARTGKVPYILVANEGQPLKKIQVSDSIVELVEDRQRFWQTLRFLAGRDQARLTAEAKAQVAALQQQVVEATEGRELAMDEIATAMAQLATAKDPNSVVWPSFVGPTGSVAPASAVRPTTVSTPATVPAAPAAASKAPTASAAAPSATGLGPKPADAPIFLSPDDEPKCTDCATCYQELPEIFERTTIIVDGEPKAASHMRPGGLAALGPVTPEMEARFERVKDTCDAEIIQ